ncbi:helix-turn-helix domain-containing protein [Leifsonia sp. Root112D2]|uniref:helix-turn-helix domain-containing protein n=1 Tax=Leifsonia sp. Root112D2 TaxID=1736426 RepID=UPI0006FDE5C1|nr:helix-turn-helix transcriptional regulator [Leifsonia sp. Root112D2]KQV07059.1 hypothetical protein ASC63_06930 [Leifsonia sp. Root112D2]
MTNYRSESSIGARIKAARRQRGYRTARELAAAMPGSNVTAATLENIESGRKVELTVSQLLNIARVLNIPPSFLLAPMGTPDAKLDLPNLDDSFEDMSAAEFDSWLTATPMGGYRSAVATERTDIDQLNALRELLALRREARRLQTVLEVQSEAGDPDLQTAAPVTESRLAAVLSEARHLEDLLQAAGWTVEPGSEPGS